MVLGGSVVCVVVRQVCVLLVPRFLTGDRWRCSAPAEKRDDDEISGAEAGACAETQLPHRQSQAEPAVTLGSR